MLHEGLAVDAFVELSGGIRVPHAVFVGQSFVAVTLGAGMGEVGFVDP